VSDPAPRRSLRSFARELYRELFEDDLLDIAAQLAFYLGFALSPFLIFLVSLIAFVPVPHLESGILDALSRVAPKEAMRLIDEPVRIVINTPRGDILFLSIAGALLFASGGTSALMDALNRAYDAKDPRPWWRVRLWALIWTVAAGILAVASAAALFVGPALLARAAGHFGLSAAAPAAWALLRWPVIVFGAVGALALLYYFLPAVEQPLRMVLPGALLATALWVLASLGFSYYAENLAAYDRTYGSLAGPMVLLLWLYLSSLSVLLGAELNALLARDCPEVRREPSRRGLRRRLARAVAGLRRAGSPARSKPAPPPGG
jgi:membrane protein